MLPIVTTLHNPVALTATCRRLNLPAPVEGSVHLDAHEVSGWILRLPGVRHPIVCNTLSGLIGYYPEDNVFNRYACILRFIHRCYEMQALLRLADDRVLFHKPASFKPRQLALAGSSR